MVVDLARSLATAAFLAARTPLVQQSWNSVEARILLPSRITANTPAAVELHSDEIDLSNARIVWETQGREPAYGQTMHTISAKAGGYWMEAEACLPDGRRLFAATNLTVHPPGPTLADALDTTNVVSAPKGSVTWSVQQTVTHDGVDAAQSGNIARGKTSRINTSVRGPGTVRFWWKAESTDTVDQLVFLVDGIAKKMIGGTKDWRLVTYVVPKGLHSLRWEYRRSAQSVSRRARGWVDQFEFGPTLPPLVTQHPVSQEVSEGAEVHFVTAANGVGLNYRWYFNGEPLADGNGVSGSRTPALTLSNVRVEQSGGYAAVVTNSAGVASSSMAVLTVHASSARLQTVPKSTVEASIHIAGSKVILTWTARAGKTYRVHYKDRLNEDAWQPLPIAVTVSGSVARIEEQMEQLRFYRIIEE